MILDRSHREFFWLLVRRDLKVRYAGSTLGGLWNLIHPLMMIAIYMTIFSSIMRTKWGGGGSDLRYYKTLEYGVHLCAGMIPWLLFSDVLTRSTGVLIENGNFLQKVSFPPIILFFSVLFNAFLIQGVGFLCFLGFLALAGKTPPAMALGGLGIMLLLGLTAMGLGLIFSGLNVFFRDTGQILNVAMQFLFWFNPIVYPKEHFFKAGAPGDATIFESVGRTLLLLNPFERFISTTQWLFGYEIAAMPPCPLDWLIVFGFPVLCLVGGFLLFRRMLPDVRDCL